MKATEAPHATRTEMPADSKPQGRRRIAHHDEPNAAVRAVLFDFGGVIIESPFEAFSRYERDHGLPAGFIRSLNARNPHSNAWARLERSEVDFDGFCAAFAAEAEAAGGHVDPHELFASLGGAFRPRMVEAVAACKRYFRTGLLTNNFTKPLSTSNHADVAHLFDVVVESSVAGIRKPELEFYLLACRDLGIEPHQAVFLDDLGVNLKPARALGMITIKVTDPDIALAELQEVLGIGLR